jgi:hypothetical protein
MGIAAARDNSITRMNSALANPLNFVELSQKSRNKKIEALQ